MYGRAPGVLGPQVDAGARGDICYGLAHEKPPSSVPLFHGPLAENTLPCNQVTHPE